MPRPLLAQGPRHFGTPLIATLGGSVAPLPSLPAILEQLRAQRITIPDGRLCVTAYGDSPEMSDELLNLIITGKKTAGSTLVWSLEADGEQPSSIGDIEIIVDAMGKPAVITRIVDTYVLPFEEVVPEHASLEGEGDRTLEYWRDSHWQFFSRECARLGRQPSRAMPVSCARFEVIHVLRRSGE